MSLNVSGNIQINFRDFDIFPTEQAVKDFLSNEIKDRLETAANDLYEQTATGRAGDVFQIQPVNARCFFDGAGMTGYRGVDISIVLNGKF